jgi:two-component system chemotaxis sensor kinase CheA
LQDRIDTASLLADYLEDARTHLDTLESALLELEHGCLATGLDRELVANLLGSLHTLKGNSGMMGFSTIQHYVHQLEGVFKRLLDAPDCLDQSLVNTLFECATLLQGSVEQIGANPLPDLSQETMFLETLASAASPKAVNQGAPPGGRGNAATAKMIQRQAPAGAADPGAGGMRSGPAPAPGATRSNVLRVDFERLDHLLNLTGELVIHKTKLNLLARQVEELAGADELFAELPRAAQLIEKTTAELQEAIMRVRMLPIRHVFQRFTRMVRDLAKQKGKEVTLSFSGEDTEIDKTVIDALGEPLIHLIRNSIDHGIELPGERLQKGKGPAGRIHLSAKQESSHIVISVEDDGGGMNAERIRSKAIEKGLITPDQVLAEDDVYGLVFQPGFSTVDQVTETSGRGVGLDVVRKVIGDFNGIIDVMSRPGLGTEFILKMPLTLAIIPALLVEVSRELYAVPLTAVLESVKVKAAEIHRVDGNEVVQLRGSVLRVKRLSRVLGLQDRDQPHYYMVVLGRAEKKTGLLVDRLRGQQEVVIKALDEYLGDVASFAGATILGDGGVVLIVDTARIIE